MRRLWFTLYGHAPFGNTNTISKKSDFRTVLDVIFTVHGNTENLLRYVKSYMREKVILIWTIIVLEEGDGWTREGVPQGCVFYGDLV